MLSRHRRFIALLTAVAITLSACSGEASENGEDPLNVFFVGGLTCVNSLTAEAIEHGARVHVE